MPRGKGSGSGSELASGYISLTVKYGSAMSQVQRGGHRSYSPAFQGVFMPSTTVTGAAILTPEQVSALVVLPLIETSVAMPHRNTPGRNEVRTRDKGQVDDMECWKASADNVCGEGR